MQDIDPFAIATRGSTLTRVILSSTCFLLAACGGSDSPVGGGTGGGNTGGGGTGGGNTGGGGTTPSYETLTSMVGNSNLIGRGVRVNRDDTTQDIQSVPLSGIRDHSAQTTVISDGLANAIPYLENDDFTGTYDYVAALSTANYSIGTATYETDGYVGILTRTEDVPAAGVATYNGEATAGIITLGSNPSEIYSGEGASTVEVNFGQRTVDVIMNRFTFIDEANLNNSVTAPIDTITISNMAITGNAFLGGSGSVTMSLNGTDVDITGNASGLTDPRGGANGHFFGYDAGNVIPDEIAGVLLIQGSTGIVAAGFIAD